MVNERNAVMKNVTNFVAGIVLAFVCGGLLAGCSSLFEEDTHFVWAERRNGKSIVGFVDDSLVIAYDTRSWYERTDEDDDQVGSGKGNQAIWIYNYRVQLDGPVFMDSLDNDMNDDFNYGVGQLSDSVVWGGDPKSEISFWKIGEKPHKIEIKKKLDGCKLDFEIKKMREWRDRLIYAQSNKGNLNAGGDTCQYAVLDTNERKITYKRLNDDLKWIQMCDDVRAWDDEIFCIALKSDSLGISLWVDDEEADVIDQPEWHKELLNDRVFQFYGCILRLRGKLYSVDYEDKKINRNPISTLQSAIELKFSNEDGAVISY